MNKILCCILPLLLTGCTLPPIPKPTETTAIVELTYRAGDTFMAENLDRKRVNDGRYFQVSEGKHRLLSRFNYDNGHFAGPSVWTDLGDTSCLISFYYDFKAGMTYQLEARSTTIGASVELTLDGEPQNLERLDISCLPY